VEHAARSLQESVVDSQDAHPPALWKTSADLSEDRCLCPGGPVLLRLPLPRVPECLRAPGKGDGRGVGGGIGALEAAAQTEAAAVAAPEDLGQAAGAGKGHHWGQCQCRELIPAGCSSSSAGQHPESRLRVLRGAAQPNGAGVAKEK